MKALGADDRTLPRFPICQVTLPWQSIDFAKMSYHLHSLHYRSKMSCNITV